MYHFLRTYIGVTERPSITTTPATLPESSTATSSIDSFTGGTSTEESVSDPGPQDGSNGIYHNFNFIMVRPSYPSF